MLGKRIICVIFVTICSCKGKLPDLVSSLRFALHPWHLQNPASTLSHAYLLVTFSELSVWFGGSFNSTMASGAACTNTSIFVWIWVRLVSIITSVGDCTRLSSWFELRHLDNTCAFLFAETVLKKSFIQFLISFGHLELTHRNRRRQAAATCFHGVAPHIDLQVNCATSHTTPHRIWNIWSLSLWELRKLIIISRILIGFFFSIFVTLATS